MRVGVRLIHEVAERLVTRARKESVGSSHNTDQYANNRVECDHGRLRARLRPMRGLKSDHTASAVISGHAFMQNLRRGHYELGIEAEPRLRVAAAFDELKEAI